MKKVVVGLAFCLCASAGLFAQQDPVEHWAALAGLEYRVVPNIVYKRANGFECKLDVITQETIFRFLKQNGILNAE